jgi:uncharacterized protein YndB with AHSA1/START domain
VHRLLKNAVSETLGLKGYALCSDACIDALGIDAAAAGMESGSEHYPDVGEVTVCVLDLETRWAVERKRRRVLVAPEEAALTVQVTLPVQPQIAWDYLTSPQKRLLWQVDEIQQVDAGGRRCTGSSSVCVDGRAKIYEEILDWRPFDYFTERTSLPGGVTAIVTTALEAEEGGTRVVTRARREGGRRMAWMTAGPRLRRRLDARYQRLVA